MHIDKNCEKCNKELINVFHNTKYCDECRHILLVENYKKQNKRVSENRHSHAELMNNLLTVVKDKSDLTISKFNQISKIHTKVYIKFYKVNWFEVLCKYEKSNELLDYVVEEYKNYINEYKKQDFKEFAKKHKFITINLIKDIGEDRIRLLSDVRKLRNTDEDYRNNFFRIVDILGRIPLFHEFTNLTSIGFYAYANHLNLKGKIYDNIVSYYVSEEEFDGYLKRKKIHKSKVGSKTGKLAAVYSDEDYEKEFRRVFENCLNEYSEMPTRRLFNQLSKIDESAYRGKYNLSWTEVCEMYGYEIDKTANKSEKTALETVKSILKENYIAQQTFDWLIGINNFPLFCDGYYPKHNLVIEFDGEQHRKPIKHYGGNEKFKILQANDQVKDNLIPRYGLKLVRISSDEPFWDKDYIENKLIECNILNNAI